MKGMYKSENAETTALYKSFGERMKQATIQKENKSIKHFKRY